MESTLAKYAGMAVKELKESGKWGGYEERINYYYDFKRTRGNTPSVRAIILIILRGETPETIPVWFETSGAHTSDSCRRDIDEIKRQITDYFDGPDRTFDIYEQFFTISDLLERRPDIAEWFGRH